MEEKIDENEVEIEYPETEVISHEKVVYPNTKSVRECRNVYQPQMEVEQAFKDGTFDVAKTMTIDRDGKFYFLSWKNQTKSVDEEFKKNQRGTSGFGSTGLT